MACTKILPGAWAEVCVIKAAIMQSFKSDALIQTLQQQTEQILSLAIREWQMIPPARFSKQPSPQSWSAAQCLSHLNGYGLYYLPLLEKAVQYPGRKHSFRSGWLGDYFAKTMEPAASGAVAKNMKAFKQHIPPAGEDSDAVIALFIEQQEQLLKLLEKAKGADLNKRIVPISIAPFIRLKTGDVFRFLIAHNRRHIAQAARALK